MRKREVVWEDPRFRKKKDRPKAIKINRFGEAPCELPPTYVPAYATASIPSGMTPPPRPAAGAGGSCARQVCRDPPSSRITRPSGLARPSGIAGRPSAVVVATRPAASMAPQGGARPRQLAYRPGTGIAQRPCPQRAAPSAVCPRPMTAVPRPSTAMPCPPAPCPAPCPPAPCPAPCPPSPCPGSPTRRQSGIPCPPSARSSGLPRRSGLRPPAVRSGLRPPTATQATTIYATRQRSPEPCPPPPCPPEPCPEDPCARRMSPPPCPPQVSTPQPRRPIGMQSGLRPPSRLMGPGSYSRSQPKPQKIVLLPGDINPHETTVITVEPPEPESYRSRSPRASAAWQPVPSVPFDLSPPSMESFRRESTCGVSPPPCLPSEIEMFFERQVPAEPCPEPQTPQFETSSALLVDIEPYEPCSMESRVVIEPVDLITFPAPDPFSPERVCRPPSPNVTPPPNPFTPPKDPIPEPSELDKWAAQYPRYKEAYTSSFHPIGEWARLKHEQKIAGGRERQVQYVDRELVAKSVPFNKAVSTICKDDDDFDDDLGLLQYMPDDLEENFNAPLDYAVLKRIEEEQREEREARRRERERQERGPTLAETRDLLARIRQAESERRAQMTGLSSCPPPAMTEEEMRCIHDRVMARHVGEQQQQQQQQQASDFSCLAAGGGGLLDDIQLDDIDLYDIDDECPDF